MPHGGLPNVYQSLFGSTPPSTDSGERVQLVLGVQLTFAVAGRVVGARWFRDDGDDGQHWAVIRSPDNSKLEQLAVFRQNAAGSLGANKWLNTYFRPIRRVAAGESIILDVFSEKGYWWYTPGLYASVDLVVGDITAPHHQAGTFFQGLYDYGNDVKTAFDGGGSAYGVDVLFFPL